MYNMTYDAPSNGNIKKKYIAISKRSYFEICNKTNLYHRVEPIPFFFYRYPIFR